MASMTLQRLVLRGLLSLPAPLLRLMSGGGVVYQGGRTLDPRLQFLAAAGRSAPGMETLAPDAARAASRQGLALLSGKPETGVAVGAQAVPGPAGPIPVRVYRPSNQDPAAPVMVFAHFGGGVIGDLDTCDVFCRLLARIARCAVVSVDYRLAPEHRFPAGLEDVLAAYRWARDQAASLGAPEGAVAIGGDSMGGNFAAIVAQEMKRTGEPQPALQLLVYPCVDVASETASMTTYGEAYPLSTPVMTWFMRHYMGPEDDPADPRLSPQASSDLKGLAPAIVVTAGFDPLVDQGEAYAVALKAAGVPVAYRCYDSLAHGFTAFTGAVPAAEVACREIAGLVREAIEGRLC
jgi:acetyl esterase/lipase